MLQRCFSGEINEISWYGDRQFFIEISQHHSNLLTEFPAGLEHCAATEGSEAAFKL